MSFFSAPKSPSKVVAVVRQSQPGFWIVADSVGRQSVAGSSETWRRGDSVVVIGGRIVGRAGKMKAQNIVEV